MTRSILFDFTTSLWVESVTSRRIEGTAGGLVDSFQPQNPWIGMRTDIEHRQRSGEVRQVGGAMDEFFENVRRSNMKTKLEERCLIRRPPV